MAALDLSSANDDRLRCHACGGIHRNARLIELPDGRVVGNYSEAWRIYCEAVWVLKKKRSKRTRIEYLDAVEEKRGIKARTELREEMMRIWNAKQENNKAAA